MKEEEKQFLIDFVLKGNGDSNYKPTKEDIEDTRNEIRKWGEEFYKQPLNDDLFCEIASRLYQEEFKDYIINDSWNRYIEGLQFLKEDNSEKKEILETYEEIIVPYYNEYTISDFEVEVLLEKSGFQIDDSHKIKEIKKNLLKLWKDKSKMLVPSTLEKDSKEWEGISFKKFLFCEEYIKTGKVTKTCESLGIGRTTAFDYLKDNEVQEYLQKRREEMKEESENLFKQGLNQSFEELLKIIKEDSMQESVLNRKVKAIDTYLRHYENITRGTEVE